MTACTFSVDQGMQMIIGAMVIPLHVEVVFVRLDFVSSHFNVAVFLLLTPLPLDQANSQVIQIQNSMLLSVRDHIRARQFGGLPMRWRLIYWKDHHNNNVQPTKDWGGLAARAQFLDQNASFPQMCILFKRICPSK